MRLVYGQTGRGRQAGQVAYATIRHRFIPLGQGQNTAPYGRGAALILPLPSLHCAAPEARNGDPYGLPPSRSAPPVPRRVVVLSESGLPGLPAPSGWYASAARPERATCGMLLVIS